MDTLFFRATAISETPNGSGKNRKRNLSAAKIEASIEFNNSGVAEKSLTFLLTLNAPDKTRNNAIAGNKKKLK